MISSKMVVLKAMQTRLCSARNIQILSVLSNKPSDPVQKLFLEKIQEYKSKSSGGKMVDSSGDIEREMKNELERVAKQFGGGAGVDMTAFPAFKFEDPQIDPISN